MLKIIFLIVSLFLFLYFFVLSSIIERKIKKLKNKENKSFNGKIAYISLKIIEFFINSLLVIYTFTVLLLLILFLSIIVVIFASD